MKGRDDLQKEVERQVRRMKKAEQERPTLIAQTVYIGTLGLLIVLPVVGGAYLGVSLALGQLIDEEKAQGLAVGTCMGWLSRGFPCLGFTRLRDRGVPAG